MRKLNKYFIIIPIIIIFFVAGEVSALRVPVDPERIKERIEAKRIYGIVVEFMNTMRIELDLIDNTKFNKIKKDASSLRESVNRMFKAGWGAIGDSIESSHESWSNRVRRAVIDFVRADSISGGVHWIEEAIQKNEISHKSEKDLKTEYLQRIKNGEESSGEVQEIIQEDMVHKISEEDIEKLFNNLRQRVKEQRKNLKEFEVILSEEIILRIAKGDYFRKIFKKIRPEIFIEQLNNIYSDILKSEITIEKGIEKFGKHIEPLDFFEYILSIGDIVFSSKGDAVLFLGESGAGKTPIATRMMQTFGFKFGNSDGIRILSCSKRLFRPKFYSYKNY